jgi:hypothetical protein
MQTRRSFIQRVTTLLGALAISGWTMLLTACNNVAQDIVTAFEQIVTILTNAGFIPNPAMVTEVEAALNAVLAEVTAYENAPAADKTTVGLKLATLIQLAQEKLQSFFSIFAPVGPVGVLVEGLIEVLLDTLAGFLPALPAPPAVAQARLAKRIVVKPIPPVTLTKHGMDSASKQFRASFNAVLTAHGYPKKF